MRKNHKEADKLRWMIVGLMVIVIMLSLGMMFVPQLDIWEAEREIHQEVQLWREQMMVPSIPTTEPTEPIHETEPGVTQPTEPATEPTEPNPLDELLQVMQDFNRDIYIEGQDELVDAFSYQSEVFDLTQYGLQSGLFGVISIPKINVELPLYLGASYDHLNYGFAQLSQTSLPIGGNNTNCVVACHRGWNGMAFMRDCELLGEGDVLYLENPWKTLKYRLSEVFIIRPDETECVYIQANRDLLTVVTCHPYGIGSHRYVLIFERYREEPEPTVEATEPTVPPETKPKPTDPELVVGWGTKITITASEGVDFKSSQMQIFWQFYFPWLCLGVIAVLFVLTMAISLISFLARKLRKKQNNNLEETV